MDAIIATALEEICSQGRAGISLQTLWLTLKIEVPLSVKKALWNNLLNIPSIQFQSRSGGVTYASTDPKIQCFEDAEKLNVKIVAKEHLCDTFLGLDGDPPVDSSNARQHLCAIDRQRRTLERISLAGKNGIMQTELAKEFGKEGKELFYDVRKLECRGLIVRQPAVLRTKEAFDGGELKNDSIVTTRLLYLYRYAQHLGSQQKFEITKEGRTPEDLGNANASAVRGHGSSRGEDVLIKDYEPAMRAVCDKLEEANDKVLVVSDIKQNLGYRAPSGHKAWRNICSRLKDAGIVEEFEAKVNKKVERCLRLLKNYEPQTLGCSGNDSDKRHLMKLGRRRQVTDQLVELPIQYQVYDMVDAAGSKGLPVIEICERLGIDNKKNHTWLHNMFRRFGMQLQKENHGKTDAYRVWTSSNFNPESSYAVLCKLKSDHSENKIFNRDVPDSSAQTSLEYDLSPLQGDLGKPQELPQDPSGADSNTELDVVSTIWETNVVPSETTPPALSKPPYQRYPCHSLTVDNVQREQRILERLQDEKFILRSELYRWLVSFEKDKGTTMDRRTVDRILKKLQQQGQCKCVHVNVPYVTDCARSRITQVFLHPSVQNSVDKLHAEIIDRMRSFELQTRGQSLSRSKNDKSVPVLDGIQRTQFRTGSDIKVVSSESMRANGFVLAKMVRAKLLHRFLWTYVSNSADLDHALSLTNNVYELKNPHTTYKLFSLETAVQAIPIELFLQVVGSTLKFDDLIEKCKKGLRLCDLSPEEYKLLRDVRANGRLSLVIDILRRLKLIRLVNDGHSDDGVKVPHATFTHALELKPYIEEPLSMVAISSNFGSLDLRPRIRHDFLLSNQEAVEEFWQTLEYSYAVADPRAASHAFPGYAVHEVSLSRSWASVRVMTADQRAELLKRIVKDDVTDKLPYKQCKKVAKDLNLTVEQVLRVYNDKRQNRLNRFESVLDVRVEDQPLQGKRTSSSKKRKKSLDGILLEQTEVDDVTGELGNIRPANLSDTVNNFTEEQNLLLASSGEHTIYAQEYENDDDDDLNNLEVPGPNEENEEFNSFISQCAFSKMKRTRQRRFLWTDEADRQLVIQYTRHRASLGAKFHRVDWSSLPDLPAPPSKCVKRMATLKRNKRFRNAMMRLCNILSEKYVKHLKNTKSSLLKNDDCIKPVQSSSGEALSRNVSNDVEYSQETHVQAQQWDDFDEKNVKGALMEVLRCKQMAKLETSRKVGSASEEWLNLSTGADQYDSQESGFVSASAPSNNIQDHGGKRRKVSAQRSRCRRLHKKFIKLLNEKISVSSQVCESLAVSNAVELFKLVFLSTSATPEVPNQLAETLRRYSERDLFAAFSYLREKGVMIGGTGDQPYGLSQQFLQRVSRSPFPTNTGKKAAKFSRWLCEEGKNLMEGGISLTEDIQCGDIFHLFALVSSGELSISPCLPDEGVGEAEDLRGLKRKIDDNESSSGYNAKKLKSITDSEFEHRRKKGFPGIMVSVHREIISRASAIELFKDEKNCTGELQIDESDGLNNILGQKVGSSCPSDHMKEIPNFGTTTFTVGNSGESPWEAMTTYAEHLDLIPSDQEKGQHLYPDIFKAIYTAIQKAGDQGLSLEEISQIIDIPGKKMPELSVDVLEAFGRALKVNAYDSIRVVDALYYSKYFLTSMAGSHPDSFSPSSIGSTGKSDGGHMCFQPKNHNARCASLQPEKSMNADDVHKVTILNLPEDAAQPSNGFQSSNVHEDCGMQNQIVVLGGDNEDETLKFTSSELSMPILPWINGDGTINIIVYKGLVRRVLGTVMQKPGILEVDIICRMDVLNPQSCKKLLESMILDKHLITRKMQQTTDTGPPAIFGSRFKPKVICRNHFFANPMSAFLL